VDQLHSSCLSIAATAELIRPSAKR